MDGWKWVPVEPTEEMNKAGMRWLTGIQHMRAGDKRNALNEAFKAMTDSAPVPPPGDVEAWAADCPEDPTKTIDVVSYTDHVAAVTRLTAERDALKYEVRDLKRWRDLALQFDNHRLAALWHLKALLQSPEHEGAAHDFLSSPPLAAHEVVAERDGLLAELSHVREERDSYQRVGIQVQSELTKARELLNQWLNMFEGGLKSGDLDSLWNETADYVDPTINQSAPAAKREHILYRDGDSIGCIPESILDRNGQVALDMCTVCGKAEAELNGPCGGAPAAKGGE